MEKKCIQCQEIKPLEVFKWDGRIKGKKGSICRKCDNERSRTYYLNNIEKVRKRKREASRKKTKKQLYERYLRVKAKDPEKYKARYTLRNAVKWGKVIKQPCQVCGNVKSQGHHEDYSKPLEVIWLCKEHHDDKHNRNLLTRVSI